MVPGDDALGELGHLELEGGVCELAPGGPHWLQPHHDSVLLRRPSAAEERRGTAALGAGLLLEGEWSWT